MDSVLQIEGLCFPKFSCRDAKQVISPITWGEFRRTVNGDLKFAGLEGGDKYRSVITCEDEVLPPFHQNWIGQDARGYSLATVTETHVVSDDGFITLHREPVSESLQCDESFELCDDGRVRVAEALGGKTIMVHYRPILDVKITNFMIKDHEWDNHVSWELHVEEV